MEKKYYDLIIDLIKQHRKYSGCEDIIDEIAEDVYSHSSVVLGTISNEDVIKSYLNKVISTSIVTVPKRLNVNTRPKVNKKLEEIVDLPSSSNEVNILVNTEEDIKEFVEETETIQKSEDSIELENSFDNSENEEFIIEETLSEPEIIDEAEEFEITKEIEELQDDSVDMSLVEKMINGVAKEEPEENANTDFECTEEIVDIVSNVEETEEPINEVSEINETFEETSEIYDSLDTVELDEDLDNIELNEIFVAPEIETMDETEAISNGEEIEEIEALETFENIEVESELEEALGESEENLTVIDTLEENLKETQVEFVDEYEGKLDEISEDSISSPSYDCFAYTPEDFEINNSEILTELQFINKKYSNNIVFQICELKYKQNLSVSEICTKTELSETEVIEILSEIINAIKD